MIDDKSIYPLALGFLIQDFDEDWTDHIIQNNKVSLQRLNTWFEHHLDIGLYACLGPHMKYGGGQIGIDIIVSLAGACTTCLAPAPANVSLAAIVAIIDYR